MTHRAEVGRMMCYYEPFTWLTARRRHK